MINGGCLYHFVALPARQPSFERFKSIPFFEIDDYDDNESSEPVYEIEERSFGGRVKNNQQNKGINLDRFKNIPLVFIDDDEEDDVPVSRTNAKQKPQKMPLFYYAEERQHFPNNRRTQNRFRNVPLIFLNEDPMTYDDDEDVFEVELHYDDVVPPVYKKPAQKPRPRPSKRPQHKPHNRPQQQHRPKPKPTHKPVVVINKPTTVAAVSMTNENKAQEFTPAPLIVSTEQTVVDVSKPKEEKNTIEVMRGTEKIEIPVPKSLEIVAFITKDGSIYEIDNGDENLLLVGKNTEKTSDLKAIMEKSLKHTIDKVFVDKTEENKPEAVIEVEPQEEVIEVVPQEISKVIEELVKEDIAKKEEVKEDMKVEEQEEVLTTPAPVDKHELPLLRNANVDTISTY